MAFNQFTGATTNTLQTGDVLNGGGTGNALNVTFGAAYNGTTPTINNVPTINATAFTTAGTIAGGGLVLSRSTGVTTIGNSDSTVDFAATGAQALTTVNVNNLTGADTLIQARTGALSGASDAVAINLSGITGTFGTASQIALTGVGANNSYETLNVASTGNNTIEGVYTGGTARTMTVTGGGLIITGVAGGQAISNGITSFDASALTGALSVGSVSAAGTANALGSSVVQGTDNNGANKALNFVGSNNGTTLFVDAGTLNTNDTLSGGSGTSDTLVLTGPSVAAGAATSVVVANAGAFTASGFENIRITDSDGEGATNAVAFNLANVTGVTGVQLNGGNAGSNVVTLNNLTYSAPVSVTATGTGAAGNLALNGLNLGFTPVSVFGNNNTVNYTFGNGGTAIGTGNAVTSGALTFNGIETLSFTFNDLSNDVTGGAAGSTVGGLALTANSATSLSVTSTGGSARTGTAIDFGAGGIGSGIGSLTNVLINSTAGVRVALNQAAGNSIVTSGAGAHTVTANIAAIAASINGSAGTGNQTLVGNSAADVIIGGAGADNLVGTVAGVRQSAADSLTGGAGQDTFVFYGSTESAAFATAAALAPNATDFALTTTASTTDIVAVSDTLTNYLAFGTAITSITGDAAAAGQTIVQSVNSASAGTALAAGADLLKLTAGATTAGRTIQEFFNAAIGTTTITGLAAANTGMFVTAYDTTNNQMVIMLASSGVNDILATADIAQLVGRVNMTAAEYADFGSAQFRMLA